MAMNRIQFQPGLSMPEFLKDYGTEAQCEKVLEAVRWPEGFRCPRCAGKAHTVVRDGVMRRLSAPGVVNCRDPFSGNQTAADYLVFGDLPGQPSQDGTVGIGAQAPTGRELPDGVADAPQTDAGHGRSRRSLYP